jgi:hypothetical protein
LFVGVVHLNHTPAIFFQDFGKAVKALLSKRQISGTRKNSPAAVKKLSVVKPFRGRA